MFKLSTGNGAAWRGLYLYWGERQLARVTIDPNNCNPHQGPHMTIGVPWVRARTHQNELCLFFFVRSFRVPMPYVKFTHPAGRARRLAYRLSNKFWCGMDGRYGWRGSCRRSTR